MITKQDAAILFAYSFKLVDKEGKEYEIVHPIENGLVIRSKNADDYYDVEHCNYNQIGTDYWVLKRPYSQMYTTIEHDGEKIVPMIELSKVAELGEGWEAVDGIGARKHGEIFSLTKSMSWSLLGGGGLKYTAPNQQQLFQKLYSLHFINLPEGTYREIE